MASHCAGMPLIGPRHDITVVWLCCAQPENCVFVIVHAGAKVLASAGCALAGCFAFANSMVRSWVCARKFLLL